LQPNFLFHVTALSRIFRGTFLEGLQQLFAGDRLQFPAQTASLAKREGFSSLIQFAPQEGLERLR
jgi:hypothetical protein